MKPWNRIAAWTVLVLLCSAPFVLAKDEPEQVKVQHILIGFKKSVQGKTIDRTRTQAKRLANELLTRAEAGEEFDDLVQEYTDDKFPGIYLMTNSDARPVVGGMKRGDMVARFGDVAFRLEVGEFGMAAHHATLSPYGWHIIKRLE